MRVYAEVLPPTLGRVMHRINAQLKLHAPPEVEFVSSPATADLQVIDVLGTGSPPLIACDRFAIIQHCFSTTETRDPGYWLPLFRRAALVVSYLDLPNLLGSDDFEFMRMAFGVDGETFCYHAGERRLWAIMTTGYNLQQEAIGECHAAVFDVLRGEYGGMLHIGPAFWEHPLFEAYENISDYRMADGYSQSRYVCGLRRGEGFELPVVEGLACGARPICFDTPNYRYWFDAHAVFVPEVPAPELVEHLAEALAKDPQPVSETERAAVLERFSWKRTFSDFWSTLLRE